MLIMRPTLLIEALDERPSALGTAGRSQYRSMGDAHRSTVIAAVQAAGSTGDRTCSRCVVPTLPLAAQRQTSGVSRRSPLSRGVRGSPSAPDSGSLVHRRPSPPLRQAGRAGRPARRSGASSKGWPRCIALAARRQVLWPRQAATSSRVGLPFGAGAASPLCYSTVDGATKSRRQTGRRHRCKVARPTGVVGANSSIGRGTRGVVAWNTAVRAPGGRSVNAGPPLWLLKRHVRRHAGPLPRRRSHRRRRSCRCSRRAETRALIGPFSGSPSRRPEASWRPCTACRRSGGPNRPNAPARGFMQATPLSGYRCVQPRLAR